MERFFLIICCTIVSFECSSFGLDFAQIDSKPLINAMEDILERFYSKETSTIFIMDESSIAINHNLKPDEIVGEIIRNNNRVLMCYVLEDQQTHNNEISNRFYNIFVVDNYESFWRVFIKMTSKTYDYTGFYTIVVTEPNDDCKETAAKIFQDVWSLYVANVNILTKTENGSVLLYTFFPFNGQYCESTEPILYDYFENDKFIYNAPIFPDKFVNFYECPLKVSSYTFAPFMMLTNQSDGTYYPDGIEGTILRAMSQRLNFTLNVIPSAFNILKSIANSSIAKVTKPHLQRSLDMVLDGKVNVSLGATTPANNRADNYSWTIIYLNGIMLFAIPPGKSYTSFEKLFFPFGKSVWFIICLLFLCSVMVIFMLKMSVKKNRDFVIGQFNDMPFFNMIEVCLGGTIPMHALPTRNFARTLLIIWLISTLVLRNAYQGILFDNLRSDQRKSPLFRLNDLYNSNLTLYLPQSFYQVFADNNAKYISRMKIYQNGPKAFHNLADENFDGAYLTIAQHVDYFNAVNPRANILKTKDFIRMVPYCMYFRKHSCLVKPFNDLLKVYKSNGLIEFWSKNFSRSSVRKPERIQLKPMSLDQFSGVNVLCACLLFSSLIVFSLELLSSKVKAIKVFFDFWVYSPRTIHL